MQSVSYKISYYPVSLSQSPLHLYFSVRKIFSKHFMKKNKCPDEITWDKTTVCNIKQENKHWKGSSKELVAKQNGLYPALYIIYLYTVSQQLAILWQYYISLINHFSNQYQSLLAS